MLHNSNPTYYSFAYMKKINIVFLSIAAGLLTTALIWINEQYVHSLNFYFVAYFIPPIAVCLILMKGNFWTKKAFLNIVLSFVVYGVIVSLGELVIFKPWEIFTTPAGSTYSRYGLDAMYPGLGAIILLISFMFSLALRFVAETIIVVMGKLRAPKKV